MLPEDIIVAEYLNSVATIEEPETDYKNQNAIRQTGRNAARSSSPPVEMCGRLDRSKGALLPSTGHLQNSMTELSPAVESRAVENMEYSFCCFTMSHDEC